MSEHSEEQCKEALARIRASLNAWVAQQAQQEGLKIANVRDLVVNPKFNANDPDPANAHRTAKVNRVWEALADEAHRLTNGAYGDVSRLDSDGVFLELFVEEIPELTMRGRKIPDMGSMTEVVRDAAQKMGGRSWADSAERLLGTVRATQIEAARWLRDNLQEDDIYTTAIYATLGAITGAIVNRSAGASSGEVFAQIPAGMTRDIINIGLSKVDLSSIENPVLRAGFKGMLGAGVTLGTNTAANGVVALLKKPHMKTRWGLTLSQMFTAFTVSASVEALREIRAGNLGNTHGIWGLYKKPEWEDPNFQAETKAEWLEKYTYESLAIGVGVLAGMAPYVFHNSKGNPKALLLAAAALLTLPTLQNLAAQAVVNPPKDVERFRLHTRAEDGLSSNATASVYNLFYTVVHALMLNPKASDEAFNLMLRNHQALLDGRPRNSWARVCSVSLNTLAALGHFLIGAKENSILALHRQPQRSAFEPSRAELFQEKLDNIWNALTAPNP